MDTRDGDPLRFSAHTQSAGFERYHRMAERAELLRQAASNTHTGRRDPLMIAAWVVGAAAVLAVVLLLAGTIRL